MHILTYVHVHANMYMYMFNKLQSDTQSEGQLFLGGGIIKNRVTTHIHFSLSPRPQNYKYLH